MSAIGVIRAAREHGRRVPDDLSVVCLHESPVAEYFDPPLTTVALPLEELGRAAVELRAGAGRWGRCRGTCCSRPPPAAGTRLDSSSPLGRYPHPTHRS